MDLSGPRFSHLQDKTRCKQLQHVKVRKASPMSQGFHRGGSRGQTHPPTSHSGEQQKHTHTQHLEQALDPENWAGKQYVSGLHRLPS